MLTDANYLCRLPAPSRAAPCAVITEAAQAESARSAWTDLLQRCPHRELTQSPEWLLTWWQVFGSSQGRQLRLGLFHDGDRLIGLAPLLRRWVWYRGCVPFRRLELLGSGEPEDSGIYSNHLAIVAERGAEEIVCCRLVRAIQQGCFDSWDEVVMPMMSGDNVMPDLLVQAFQAAEYHVAKDITARAPYITLPASWKEYLGQLTSSSRRSVQRSLKAFDEWSAGTTRLDCITSPDDLERGKEILVRLHQDRWGAAHAGGVFRAPPFIAFHDRIMRDLAEHGGLELLLLYARGEPVAALYSMVWEGKVYAYQMGRRPDVPAAIRLGGVLLALAIRRAIEMGRREFDLLADDAFYKRQFTPCSRALVQVRAVRASLREKLRHFTEAGFARLRQFTHPASRVP